MSFFGSPLGNSAFSRYVRSVTHCLALLAVAQLERDLIAERVRNGLANAKAKGVRLGRLKTRQSELIRQLRKSGMTYRQIAKIAEVSSGAVAAELRALKKEIADGVTPAVQAKPKVGVSREGLSLVESESEPKIELEITRLVSKVVF